MTTQQIQSLERILTLEAAAEFFRCAAVGCWEQYTSAYHESHPRRHSLLQRFKALQERMAACRTERDELIAAYRRDHGPWPGLRKAAAFLDSIGM